MNYKNIFFIIITLSSFISYAKTFLFTPHKGLKLSISLEDKDLFFANKEHDPFYLRVGERNYAKLKLYKIDISNNSDSLLTFETSDSYLPTVNNYTSLKKYFAFQPTFVDFFLIGTLGGFVGSMYEVWWKNLRDDFSLVCFFIYSQLTTYGTVTLFLTSVLHSLDAKKIQLFMQHYFLHENTVINPRARVIKYFFIAKQEKNNSQKLLFKDENGEKIEIDFLLH